MFQINKIAEFFGHMSINFENIETKTTGQYSPVPDASFDNNFDVLKKKMLNVNCGHGFQTYKPEIRH